MDFLLSKFVDWYSPFGFWRVLWGQNGVSEEAKHLEKKLLVSEVSKDFDGTECTVRNSYDNISQ